jgi:hypothetical protein
MNRCYVNEEISMVGLSRLLPLMLLLITQNILGDSGSVIQPTESGDLASTGTSIFLDQLDPRPDPFDTRSAVGRSWLLAIDDTEPGEEEGPVASENGGEVIKGGKKSVNTGNDPRDFTHKFMPYYRYTDLSNGMETQDFTVFGMWAINKNAALTYEVPVARKYDITGTPNCAGLPEIPCFGTIPGGGATLPNGLPAEGDGVETGMGDSIIRIFGNWNHEFLGGAAIWGAQFTVPTATKDELGTETWSGGPIATFVWDVNWWPAPGSFFAMMNIFEVDFFKDSGRGDIGRYLGRWFLQLPVNKKHKLYLMMEFQPVYDWEADHFSLWVAPEFGKAFAPSKGIFRNGGALYIKPGWGISPNAKYGDRDFTFEIGIRFFFGKPGPDNFDRMMQAAR